MQDVIIFATSDWEIHWKKKKKSKQETLCPEAVHLDKRGSKLKLNDRLKRSMAAVYGVQGRQNVKLPGSETWTLLRCLCFKAHLIR